MRQRYPNTTIGWSTHEDPNDLVPVSIAIGKGARMFERHVGKETSNIKLNSYSSTPEQIDKWISGAKKALVLCGGKKRKVNNEEISSINSLKRSL